MIPIRDTVIGRNPPIATWLIIGLNVLVFYLELVLPTEDLERTAVRLGLVPILLTQPQTSAASGATFPPYWSLITCLFLHGGWVHLIGNMWTLAIFGDNVEDRMGPGRFTLFYLCCGTLAGACHVMANPDSTVPTLGASGAIAGVMGAYFVLFPTARIVVLIPLLIIPLFFHIPAILYIAYWFLIQFLSGVASIIRPETGVSVAFWAHVGGFLSGVLLFWLFLRPEGRRFQAQGDEGCMERAWS